MSETKDLEIIHQPQRSVVKADDFMPLLSVDQAVARKGQINQFIGQVLKEDDDYGKMPGDTRRDAKKVLLKPGAEKLCSIFGLAPQYLEDKIVEDWTGKDHGGEPLFYYAYRCQLMRGDRFMGEAIGSANSWEVKYRYRWVNESQLPGQVGADGLHLLPQRGGKQSKFEPDFAIAKRETSGQYGHPAEYWDQFTAAAGAKRVEGRKLGTRTFNGWEITMDATQYRIPNPDTADIINTLQKMAQKRALVAAVLVVTNCSDAFTQDLEDEPPTGEDPGTGSAPATGASQQPKDGEEPMLVLPEELAALFGPEAPEKGALVALEMCRRELSEAFPYGGAPEEYRKAMALNKVVMTGATVKSGDLRKACVQMWTLARRLKSQAKRATVEDAGPAKFGQDDDWGPGRQ